MQSFYLQHLVGKAAPGRVRAALHRSHGDVLGAARELEALVEVRPRHVSARIDLAELYLELGREAPAREQLERARAFAPDDPRVIEAWKRLGRHAAR